MTTEIATTITTAIAILLAALALWSFSRVQTEYWLERILKELRAVRLAVAGPWRFSFTAILDNHVERDVTMFVMSNSQQVQVSIKPVDRFNNPAPVDGRPNWTISGDVIDLIPSADGMSAVVVAKGTIGQGQVSVTADAALGEGVTPITGVLDIEVRPSAAVALKIEAGEPTEK